MAHSLSAKKRIRQNAKHRARNRAHKAELKDKARSLREVIAAGDQAKAGEALRTALKTIDRFAAKGTLHRNTAARRKSLLQRQFNAATGKGAAPAK